MHSSAKINLHVVVRMYPHILAIIPDLRDLRGNLLGRPAVNLRQQTHGPCLRALEELQLVPGTDFFLLLMGLISRPGIQSIRFGDGGVDSKRTIRGSFGHGPMGSL